MSALALRQRPDAEDVLVPIPPDFRLQSGDRISDRFIQLRRFGVRNGPQVVALGGISAGRDVCGDDGWWRETIVDSAAIDLDRFGVIGVDFAPLADERVRLAPVDQARLVEIALDRLGIEVLRAFVGASYGGLVGLAFAARAPRRLEQLCIISAAHRPAAQALAWRGVQRRIVEYGIAQDDPAGGLALARQVAMITYRTAREFDVRFGAGLDAQGQGEVDRYLESRGEAYTEVALPQRWLSLSEAIDRAFVDPAAIETPTTLVACEEDQLVPAPFILELARTLPNLRGHHVFSSFYGHDAFLKEPTRVAAIITNCLEEPR
jgi:homoserine O-acetyltransferase